uniref:Uncharacterized protein n=1 Tax=Cucumis melo TaxID=3656 RepID=A0A9I9E6D7_CUCME
GLISVFFGRDEGQKALEIEFSRANPSAFSAEMEDREVKKPRTRAISGSSSAE